MPRRIVRYQQHDLPSRAVPTQVTPQGWPSEVPVLFAKKFPAIAQQFTAFAESGTLVSLTPQGWHPSYPERFVKKVPAALQRFEVFQPFGEKPAFSVDMSDETVIFTRNVIYDDVVDVPQPLVNFSLTPQGWPSVFPERFAKRFPVSAMMVTAFPEYQVATRVQPEGWPVIFPERFKKKFGRELQLFTGDTWRGSVPTAAVPPSWPAIFPERFAKRYPPSLTQFDLPVLQVYVSTPPSPEGWRGYAPDKVARFKLNVVSLNEGPAQGRIDSLTPQGWPSIFPELFRKKFPPALQVVTFFPQYQVPTRFTAPPSVDFPLVLRRRMSIEASVWFVRTVGVEIIAKPPLQGADSPPLLDGISATISIRATSGDINLDGTVTS